MTNFRQRMGWTGVGLYLLASAEAFSYVCGINETYSRLALEHIQQHPEEPREGTTWTHSLKARLLSLPFWLWTVIFLIPYLQMFLFLYSCTGADPQTVGYCIVPEGLAVLCDRHQAFVKASNKISRLQLIDTYSRHRLLLITRLQFPHNLRKLWWNRDLKNVIRGLLYLNNNDFLSPRNY
ncbi:lysosomal enzyme trafficking factor-like [Chionomys nivalis]|uniref:lysosomal enzyme trafficking factor-like n=1 Tax=Chionomys nivalis TaxID=269649 RepID=UPI00259AB304|nr:lysosomal enzyme trafficking factor-like [Chionomys nivalis]